MTTQDHLPLVAEGVRKKLDHHGYSFQQALYLASLQDPSVTAFGHHWEPYVAEFPAKPPNFAPTHIDLLLRSKAAPMWMVVEAKRSMANQATWCFIEPHFMGARVPRGKIFIEAVTKHPNSDGVSAVGRTFDYGESHRYSTMFTAISDPRRPTDSQTDQDESRSVKRAEEAFGTACRQLMQGVNGLVEQLNSNSNLVGTFELGLLPVIVTTASLYRITGAFQESALQEGRLKPESLQASEQPWLLYHFVQTPDLRHSLDSSQSAHSSLGQVLSSKFIRTIAVVTAEHWKDFLSYFDPGDVVFQAIR